MKAQVKMFETIGVLIVFFFLLITASVFYFRAQSSALEKERFIAGEKYAFQIVLKSLYMPELDCSFLVTQKDNCIDKIKLTQFSKLLRNTDMRDEYFAEFGYATITVTEIFPKTNDWFVYENIPLDETIEPPIPLYVDKLVTQSPILLYDPWQEIYAFGVIEVTVYVQ